MTPSRLLTYPNPLGFQQSTEIRRRRNPKRRAEDGNRATFLDLISANLPFLLRFAYGFFAIGIAGVLGVLVAPVLDPRGQRLASALLFHRRKRSDFVIHPLHLSHLFACHIINHLLVCMFFTFLQGKIYWLFGWEYRKPERVPPSCPYKPASQKIVDVS
ncbi:hypothetical protein BHE74_00036664 [Ensete ventricosum]|nr:hypothetical protein BHE74_00036664 [Ensete ventricosum]